MSSLTSYGSLTRPFKQPSTIDRVAYSIESGFRDHKDFPHYKYFIRPIYRSLVERVGPASATALTFLASDLVIHQALPQALSCFASTYLGPITPKILEPYCSCEFTWNPLKTLLWMAVSVPVIYRKIS